MLYHPSKSVKIKSEKFSKVRRVKCALNVVRLLSNTESEIAPILGGSKGISDRLVTRFNLIAK